MQAVKLTLRCMAWCEQGQWVAACLDLSLAAQAPTVREAQAKLHSQIVTYVREAVTIDAAHADELLSRRAPLQDRIRYQFWQLVERRPRLRRTVGQAFRRLGVALKRKLAYIEPVPMLPAV